jgi:hypothetical protein
MMKSPCLGITVTDSQIGEFQGERPPNAEEFQGSLLGTGNLGGGFPKYRGAPEKEWPYSPFFFSFFPFLFLSRQRVI